MLIVWLVCAFGLISQTKTITANSTHAAITATSPAIEIDSSDAISDLDKAETKDATKKLEIIKQIRRVNNDGSYTVGYEAVDGTFKIESRDVLGNVKGTYGYVDENGEIKRVSYTANNTTSGLKSTPQPVEQIVQIPRQNKTGFSASSSTTRRPTALTYLASSTTSPLRVNSNVIQAIPKRRILLASSPQQTSKNPYTSNTMTTKKMEPISETSNTQKTEPTTTIVYATSVRSTAKPSAMSSTEPPPARSNKVEINDRFSKVLNMNKNVKTTTSTDSSSTEQSDIKSERKPVRGNALRRQLPSDQSENYESHSQIVYSQSSDEDSVHNPYSGVTGPQRPVFTTTSSPRIPALVLAARNRAAMLKNAALQSTSTTEKVYSKPPRRKSDRRDENSLTTETSSDNEYLTQSPVAVQIPANRDNEHVYRHPNAYLPRPREYLRQSQSSSAVENNNNNSPRHYKLPVQVQVQPTFVQTDAENEQYLRETSESSIKGSTTSTPEQYVNNDLNAATQPILQSFNPRAPRLYGAQQQQGSRIDFDQRLQQQQSIQQPYQPQPVFGSPNFVPPYYNQGPERPLTARDFERLLNLLVLRHQQYNRINLLPGLMNQNYYGGYGNGYGGYGGGLGGFGGFGGGGFGGGNGYGFGGYNPYNYQQIPRPPLYNQFDPRYTGFSRSLPPVPPPHSLYAPYSEQENMYQAQSPVEQQIPYMQRPTQSRRNFNNQPYFDRAESNDISQQKVAATENGEYLPPDVREELLYRMLMLAIQPDVSASIPVPDASTIQEYFKSTMPATATTTSPEPNSKKPVRSVQILGEE